MRAAGFERLYLVAASHAVIDSIPREWNTVLCTRLYDAISDVRIAFGVTRRTGQRRKVNVYGLNEYSAAFAGSCKDDLQCGAAPAAFVFGNETSGLSDEELQHCHAALAIPTSPGCPSLNLSHAVALVAYTVSRNCVEAPPVAPGISVPNAKAADRDTIATETLDDLIDDALENIRRAGFLTQEGPQGMRVFLRDLCARAGLSGAEAAELGELFLSVRERR